MRYCYLLKLNESFDRSVLCKLNYIMNFITLCKSRYRQVNVSLNVHIDTLEWRTIAFPLKCKLQMRFLWFRNRIYHPTNMIVCKCLLFAISKINAIIESRLFDAIYESSRQTNSRNFDKYVDISFGWCFYNVYKRFVFAMCAEGVSGAWVRGRNYCMLYDAVEQADPRL